MTPSYIIVHENGLVYCRHVSTGLNRICTPSTEWVPREFTENAAEEHIRDSMFLCRKPVAVLPKPSSY